MCIPHTLAPAIPSSEEPFSILHIAFPPLLFLLLTKDSSPARGRLSLSLSRS